MLGELAMDNLVIMSAFDNLMKVLENLLKRLLTVYKFLVLLDHYNSMLTSKQNWEILLKTPLCPQCFQVLYYIAQKKATWSKLADLCRLFCYHQQLIYLFLQDYRHFFDIFYSLHNKVVFYFFQAIWCKKKQTRNEQQAKLTINNTCSTQ